MAEVLMLVIIVLMVLISTYFYESIFINEK